jgi:tetratricopeptide (TPR) repeat protein
MTLAASSYPLMQLGRRQEARQRLDAALDRLDRARQYPAKKVELRSPADQTLRALAAYDAANGNVDGACARYEELLCLIFASDPQSESRLEDAVALSNLYADAASMYRRAGRRDAASTLDSQRLQLWQHWETALPGNAFVSRQMEACRRTPVAQRKKS